MGIEVIVGLVVFAVAVAGVKMYRKNSAKKTSGGLGGKPKNDQQIR